MTVTRFRITERQVLLLIMGASIIAYVGAILVVTFRQKGRPPDLSRPPRVRWMPPQSGKGPVDIRYVVADLLDPSLMSLPSPHGFSLLTWEHQPAATYRPPEPPVELAFLHAGTPALPEPLLNEPSLKDALQTSVQRLVPESEEPAETLPVEITTAADKTVVEFMAGLDQRTLAEPPELPTITSEASLRPTRLRIAVTPDGAVRYAMLEGSCGSEPVDKQALTLARALRFETQEGASAMGLTWGVARFVWATAAPPPAATNGVSEANETHN